MSENLTVSCQISSDWNVKIERLATERKQPPEQIVYEAIAQYLGENSSTADTRLSHLEQEVSSLSSTVSELTATVKDLQQKLVRAASIISFSETPPVKLETRVQNFQPELDEDIEDEPDEILYDFLPPRQI